MPGTHEIPGGVGGVIPESRELIFEYYHMGAIAAITTFNGVSGAGRVPRARRCAPLSGSRFDGGNTLTGSFD